MKKLILIVWGALLLVKQGTIIGMEKATAKIGVVEITVLQANIVGAHDINAIVHPTTFDLKHYNTTVGANLGIADPEWLNSAKKLYNLSQNLGFRQQKIRAFISPTSELRGQEVKWVINAAGPTGEDPEWEKKLKKTYLDILNIANKSKYQIKSLALPPISSITTFSWDANHRKVITPTKEANIAISAINQFIQQNPNPVFKEIYLTTKPKA